jgi:hypothetical protein
MTTISNTNFSEEFINSLFDKSTNTSELIISKIHACDINFILNGICYIKDDALVIDYNFFKHFASTKTYDIIQHYFINNIDIILTKYDTFTVYLNMKSLTISQIDKHRNYLNHISLVLKERYPDTLLKCYVYDAPFVFSQLYNIISMFLDRETLKKIQIVK